MLLKEAINDFRKYTAVTKAEGTQEHYIYYLKILERDLGIVACKNISSNNILDYIIKRKEYNPKVSNATLNKHLVALKAAVKYATGIKIEFRKLKEQKKLIQVVSEATFIKIFSYYQKHLNDPSSFRNYLFLKLLLDTGLRLSEIKHIRVSDIDFESSSIHIKITKTDVDRFVCFTDQAKKLLITFIAKYKISELLFFDFKTGNKMTTSSVESFIYRLKKKLEIKESITPHKWRHTFATNFLRGGGDLETLRLLMGHANLKTTQKYLHLSKNDIFKQYRKVMNQENM